MSQEVPEDAPVTEGRTIPIFDPGAGLGIGDPTETGQVLVQGPHYPEPHRWYAQVWIEESNVVRFAGTDKNFKPKPRKMAKA